MTRRPLVSALLSGIAFFTLLSAFLLALKRCNSPARSHRHVLCAVMEVGTHGATHSDDGQWHGFQYEILKRFTDSMGMELNVVPARDLPHSIRLLTTGRCRLLATAMPATTQWNHDVYFTHHLFISRQMLVQRACPPDETGCIRKQHELAGRTVSIPKGAPYFMHLEHLSDQLPDKLHIEEVSYTTLETLAQRVARSERELTTAHEQLARKLQRENPELDTSLPLTIRQPYCWAVDKQSVDLLHEIDAFLARFVGSQDYWRLYRKYY